MSKKHHISTDLFKGKVIPEFLKNHDLFTNPVKISKVFPSIGLPNFKDKAAIDKCFVDLKKEGSYVFSLLKIMSDIASTARDNCSHLADRIQYLESRDSRKKNQDKINELYNLTGILTELSSCTDPYNREVLDNAIHTVEGKIQLKLIKVINSSDKTVIRKDSGLFSIFDKMRERCIALGIDFKNLNQTDPFRIFSKENMPNKEFSVVFSSEGNDGAWDIATMSMRGIKSCQRWDGEYHRCIIGSIISKFVGIIYLTSGVQSDNQGPYVNLGTKMIRRCVVRYAIDADEEKPCIILDKMYPENDKDVLALFINAIKSKTELPVYYAQADENKNKIKHMYLPTEKIREDVSDREWSYQDTPLKSRNDLNVFLLNNNKDEIEREIRGFKLNLSIELAREMENVYNKTDITVSDEIKRTVKNIRMNTSFSPFADQIINTIFSSFYSVPSEGFLNSKTYYRKYLMDFLMRRKKILAGAKSGIDAIVMNNVSRVVSLQEFNDFIFAKIAAFTKQEIVSLIN